jgi:hypothetical protein
VAVTEATGALTSTGVAIFSSGRAPIRGLGALAFPIWATFAPAFDLVGGLTFGTAALAASAALFARVLAALAAAALAASIFARWAATRSDSIRSDSFREYSAACSPRISRSWESRASSMALAELCSLWPRAWSWSMIIFGATPSSFASSCTLVFPAMSATPLDHLRSVLPLA